MAEMTETLQTLMKRANIASYRALADQAGVSRWQVQQLRQGKMRQMRMSALAPMAAALNLSLADLITAFSIDAAEDAADSEAAAARETVVRAAADSPSASASEAAALRKEYGRLQAQLETVTETARQSLQSEALDRLESWLVQWPTIVHRAQQNDSLPAAKVVKFVDPVMRLVESWGVSAIAPVGTTVPYDPQRHQLKQGTAQPGEPVEVISPGYTYQGKLLHRAMVKP
ncbi:MAG: helix-turn-helix domain-containing protein [Cyanobacteria bacterium J06632_22]